MNIFLNIKSTIVAVALLATALPAMAQSNAIRLGAHSFTIQWISFNEIKPGTVLIKAGKNGLYTIEGEQRDKPNNEYVTIKGTIEVIKPYLYFNGKITSRIASINNGQPCELNGQAVFKASGKRKYWRLQQMLNCDKIHTDYIDIFF